MYVESGYIDSGYFGGAGTRAAFLLGSQTLVFQEAPLRPPVSLALIQAEGKSAGAVRVGHPVWAADDLIDLRWPRMHAFALQQLRAWWSTVARGMAVSFVYRDPWDVLRTVRFASSELPEVREVAYGRFEVSFRLRIES